MALNPVNSRGAASSISGVTVSGTPSAGQVLTATSATAADWETPSIGVGTLVTKDLTAAQIAALGSTPITVLAAPAAGFAAVVMGWSVEFKGGTHPFARTADVRLYEGSNYLGAVTGLGLNTPSAHTFRIGPSSEANAGGLATALTVKAATAVGLAGSILTSAVGASGGGYKPTDTFTVDAGDGLATGVVDTVSDSFVITAVNQGAKTFTVTGDASAFNATDDLVVYGSTGNDGDYTIVSAVFGGGSTVITVAEAIPDATGDGRCGDATLHPGEVGGVATYHLTATGDAYGVSQYVTLTSGVGSGFEIEVLTITPTSDGTARVTVAYYLAATT